MNLNFGTAGFAPKVEQTIEVIEFSLTDYDVADRASLYA